MENLKNQQQLDVISKCQLCRWRCNSSVPLKTQNVKIAAHLQIWKVLIQDLDSNLFWISFVRMCRVYNSPQIRLWPCLEKSPL